MDFPETRVSLILRLREPDDVQAWQEFVEIYAPSILGLALRKGLQRADAEDVTQDILFGIARAIDRFQPDESRARFRTWLSRISRNLLVDFHWKKQRRQPVLSLTDSLLANNREALLAECRLEDDFEQEYRTSLFQFAAKRVRQRVSSKTWSAFQMTAIDAKDAEAVADELAMAVGTVYVSRCRVLKLLREEVERLDNAFSSADYDSPSDAGASDDIGDLNPRSMI